jgi:hypothetical protein
MTRRPLPVRTLLCVGLLGSAAAVVLGPNPLLITVAVGVFAACSVTVAARATRRASRRIDRIFAEELESTQEITLDRQSDQESWRKSA